MVKFKDVLTVINSAGDEAVIQFAERVAEAGGGSFTTLVIGWMPTIMPAVEGYVIDPTWGDVVRQAQKELSDAQSAVSKRLAQTNERARVESNFLQFGAARSVIGMRARHADLTIVRRPNLDAGDAIVEGALFESGRPVVIIPGDWKPRPIGRSVLVCWKPTREAARALGDADDFIRGASRVTVATVDAKPSEEGYGEHPGADISAHLARRGLNVDLTNLDSLGRSQAKTIIDHAIAVDADLIVMGGYGRSRLSEFVFGGVTREMLQLSPVPLFMAH